MARPLFRFALVLFTYSLVASASAVAADDPVPAVERVISLPGRQKLILAWNDGQVTTYDVRKQTMAPLRMLGPLELLERIHLEISRDGKRFLVSGPRHVEVFEGARVRSLFAREEVPPFTARLSDKGDRLWINGRLWSVDSGKLLDETDLDGFQEIAALDELVIKLDKRTYTSGYRTGYHPPRGGPETDRIVAYRVGSDAEAWALEVEPVEAGQIAVSPDGRRFAIVEAEQVRLFDTRGTAVAVIRARPWYLSGSAATFSPNGSLLAITEDGQWSLWDTRDGRSRGRFGSKWALGLRFLDNDRVVTGGLGTKVWDLRTLTPTLELEPAGVVAAADGASDLLVFSSPFAPAARIFDARSGRELGCAMLGDSAVDICRIQRLSQKLEATADGNERLAMAEELVVALRPMTFGRSSREFLSADEMLAFRALELCTTYLDLNRFPDAERVFSSAASAPGPLAQIGGRLGLARLLWRSGRLEEAAELAEAAMQRAQGVADAGEQACLLCETLKDYVGILARLGRDEGALAVLDAAAAARRQQKADTPNIYEQLAQIQLMRADILERQGKLAPAYAALRHIVDRDWHAGVAAPAHILLGRVLYRQGRPEEAEAYFGKAAEALAGSRGGNPALELQLRLERGRTRAAFGENPAQALDDLRGLEALMAGEPDPRDPERPFRILRAAHMAHVQAAWKAAHPGTDVPARVVGPRVGTPLALGKVRTVDLSEDGSTAVSGHESGSVAIWDLKNGRNLAVLEVSTNGASAQAAFALGAGRLVIASWDTAAIWDWKARRPVKEFAVGFLRSGGLLLSDDRRRALVYDGLLSGGAWLELESGAVRRTSVAPVVSLAADGSNVQAERDGRVCIRPEFPPYAPPVSPQRSAARLSGTPAEVAVSSASERSEDARCIRVGETSVFGGDDNFVTFAHAVRPGSDLIVFGRKVAGVFDIASGEPRVPFDVDELQRSAAVAKDQLRVASGGEDGVIRIWDSRTGEQLARIDRHDGAVTSLVFSADGRRLLSGGEDGTIRVWDAETGLAVARFGAAGAAAGTGR